MAQTEKKKVLTEQQQKFLDVLFEEGIDGNIRKAMKAAGYSDTTPSSVVIRSLHNEITEIAKQVLASQSIKAVIATVDVLDNSGQLGASNKLKAADMILSRAGVEKEKTQDINLKVPAGGLVILPAKTVDDVDNNVDNTDEAK